MINIKLEKRPVLGWFESFWIEIKRVFESLF